MEVRPPATKATAVSPPTSMWNSPSVYEHAGSEGRNLRESIVRSGQVNILFAARHNFVFDTFHHPW